MSKRASVLMFVLAVVVFGGCQTHRGAWEGRPPGGPLSEPMMWREAHSLRASTWDRSGGNMDWLAIPPGETVALLEAKGAGCVRHMYWTYIVGDEGQRKHQFRDLILRMYWDGEPAPSVQCPIGDFFTVANAKPRPVKSLAMTVNPGTNAEDTSWGMNCYLPMPFADGARIEVTNEAPCGLGVWVHIDYETYETVPGWMADAGRFHAQWRRERVTPITNAVSLDGKENYVILEAKGRGALAGYMLSVDSVRPGWWGEGDDAIFVDGEVWPPSFHGTGSEEIFGGGACPSVEYSGPYTGFHLIENAYGNTWYGKNGMYRFFVTDPIRFKESLLVTIESLPIFVEPGHPNDYSSVAYWYQFEPHAPFPSLPPSEARQPLGPPAPPPKVEGAIEGEGLVDRAETSGPKATALRFAGDVRVPIEVEFSDGQFLWFVGREPGDYTTGVYEVVVHLVMANDFGIVEVSMDGKPMGTPFDGYNNEGGAGATHVKPSGPVSLGTMDLGAGEHWVTLTLTGKSEGARGLMTGLDCILLRQQ